MALLKFILYHTYSTIVVIIILFFPHVILKISMLIDCVPIDSETNFTVLKASPDQQCYTEQHWLYVLILGFFSLFFYIIGIPCYFLYFMYKNKKYISEAHKEIEDKLSVKN